jgi:hypothetical protein
LFLQRFLAFRLAPQSCNRRSRAAIKFRKFFTMRRLDPEQSEQIIPPRPRGRKIGIAIR